MTTKTKTSTEAGGAISCGWYTSWLCGDCRGDEKCPNYIKPEVEVNNDNQLKLFEI